jgi:high-affinity iron transporter
MKKVMVVVCLWMLACQEAPKQEAPVQVQASAEDVEQGQALYKRYGCAVCHGRMGNGNGQIARTLNPRPRDFNNVRDYKYGRSIDAITRTIGKGTINEQGMGMPGYPQIPEAERKLIAAFVVSLQEEK